MSHPRLPLPRLDAGVFEMMQPAKGVHLTVSVLMSTYDGEDAENLAACLESLARQSRRPEQLVLVVDGPVGEEQEQVIAQFLAGPIGPAATVLRLSSCQGLAAAMNAGLKHCTGSVTFRMDSDDLCEPDRIARQIAYLAAHPETDLVSSWSEEFFTDGAPSQLKVSPIGHDAIVSALRWRNVLVHPTVAVKTEWLRRVGGYRSRYGQLEDYDLFVRLALAGAQFHVIPKVLVRVRSSTAQRARRGGLAYFWNDVRFRIECLSSGFLNGREFIMVTGMYALFRLVSGSVRRRFYALARV